MKEKRLNGPAIAFSPHRTVSLGTEYGRGLKQRSGGPPRRPDAFVVGRPRRGKRRANELVRGRMVGGNFADGHRFYRTWLSQRPMLWVVGAFPHPPTNVLAICLGGWRCLTPHLA